MRGRAKGDGMRAPVKSNGNAVSDSDRFSSGATIGDALEMLVCTLCGR